MQNKKISQKNEKILSKIRQKKLTNKICIILMKTVCDV